MENSSSLIYKTRFFPIEKLSDSQSSSDQKTNTVSKHFQNLEYATCLHVFSPRFNESLIIDELDEKLLQEKQFPNLYTIHIDCTNEEKFTAGIEKLKLAAMSEEKIFVYFTTISAWSSAGESKHTTGAAMNHLITASINTHTRKIIVNDSLYGYKKPDGTIQSFDKNIIEKLSKLFSVENNWLITEDNVALQTLGSSLCYYVSIKKAQAFYENRELKSIEGALGLWTEDMRYLIEEYRKFINSLPDGSQQRKEHILDNLSWKLTDKLLGAEEQEKNYTTQSEYLWHTLKNILLECMRDVPYYFLEDCYSIFCSYSHETSELSELGNDLFEKIAQALILQKDFILVPNQKIPEKKDILYKEINSENIYAAVKNWLTNNNTLSTNNNSRPSLSI